ncbi:MAG: hypothetical protein PHS81_03495 [Candidatus Nanoarchaeia archaeon]|nr:hypothetical protein [Candidatus Nanoarchaeia archaeon]
MFKHYTITFRGEDFLDSQGLLKKAIILARKDNVLFFSLLELRITDNLVYFNDGEGSNNDLRTSNFEYFNSLSSPLSVPENMVRESNDLEIELFKKEFEKRCDNLFD